MSFLFTSDARRAAIALTALRIVTGAVFVAHGYQKLFVMGLGGVAGAFTHMGAPLPGLTGPLFALCEFFFGIAVILGLLTRVGALWFVLDMLGAIAVVHIGKGWSGPGGMEFPTLLLAASFTVLVAGPGCFAVDNIFARRVASGKAG